MNVSDCRLIDLPKFLDKRGNLSFAEEFKHIPFKIERTYWIYDVPGGEKRGGHAYKENQEFIIALSGSFDVLLDDGKERRKIHLNLHTMDCTYQSRYGDRWIIFLLIR